MCAAYWGYMSNILKIIVVVFELGQPEYFIDLKIKPFINDNAIGLICI